MSSRLSTSRLSLLVLIGLVVVMNGGAGHEVTLAEDCTCKPNRQSAPYSNAPKFYLQDSWYPGLNISLLGNEFADAKSEWNAALIASGSDVRLGWNTSDNAVMVYFDDAVCPDWAETRTSPQVNPRRIRICPDLLTNQAGWDFVQRVVRHELGHVLGLAQNPECSTDESVMTEMQPPQVGPSTAKQVGCADGNAIRDYFTPPPVNEDPDGDNDGYPMSVDCRDDLWDVYPGAPISCWGSPSGYDDANCANGPDWGELGCTSPLLIDVAGDGFDLTSLASGVQFDLNSDGIREQLSWTSQSADESWLTLDRNANGTVDDGTELFGSFTPQPTSVAQNGFAALAVFDHADAGGNADGWIDAQDVIFSQLRLWRDFNHDGISQLEEFQSLSSAGLVRLSLDYKEARRRDRWGNGFRYRSKVVSGDASKMGVYAYDVYLLTTPPENVGAMQPSRRHRD